MHDGREELDEEELQGSNHILCVYKHVCVFVCVCVCVCLGMQHH